jgi:hypothetical protein
LGADSRTVQREQQKGNHPAIRKQPVASTLSPWVRRRKFCRSLHKSASPSGQALCQTTPSLFARKYWNLLMRVKYHHLNRPCQTAIGPDPRCLVIGGNRPSSLPQFFFLRATFCGLPNSVGSGRRWRSPLTAQLHSRHLGKSPLWAYQTPRSWLRPARSWPRQRPSSHTGPGPRRRPFQS